MMKNLGAVLSFTALIGCGPGLKETVCLPEELRVIRDNAEFVSKLISAVNTQDLAEESRANHNGIGHEGDELSRFHSDYAIRCGVVLEEEDDDNGGQTDVSNGTFLINVDEENFLFAKNHFNQEDMVLFIVALNELSLEGKGSVDDLAQSFVGLLVYKLVHDRGMSEFDAALYLYIEMLEMMAYSVQLQVHEVAHYIHPLSREEMIEHNDTKSDEERKAMCLTDKIYAADEVYKITLSQLYDGMQTYLRQKYPVVASEVVLPLPFSKSVCE